jgi:hypothetical protein
MGLTKFRDDPIENGDVRVRRYRLRTVEEYSVSMRRVTARLVYVLAVFAGFVTILLGFASNASALEEGSITGRVTSAVTGVGISDINVCANGSSFGGCEYTNSNGEYKLQYVRPGSYTVQFTSPDPVTLNYIPQEIKNVVVAAGESHEVSAALQPGGWITGRVTDAATQAGIEGLEVCAGSRSERVGAYCARSGQNGEYTISEVPEGSYIVEFYVPFQGGGLGDSQSDLDYAPQYYDGRVTPAEAEEVAVTAGEATGGVDAAMQPGGKITGVVTDAVTHDQVAGIEVCAYRPLEYGPSRCDATNTDGEYTINPLVSGEYVVEFTAPSNGPLDYAPQYYSDQASGEQANKVPVTVGETTSGIDAAMQSGGGITGQVTVAATGSPLMNAEVCAFSLAALSVGNEGPERCVQTNANGEYSLLQLAAGQDIVEFYDEFGVGFVRQYYDGKSSRAEAMPLSVTPGITITGVDASLHAIGEETIKPTLPTETALSTNLAFAVPLLPKTAIATIMGSKLVVSGGSAAIRVACHQAACQGSVELVQAGAKRGEGRPHQGKSALARNRRDGETVVLATASFSLAEGKDGAVLLRLTPAGRQKLAHASRHHPIAAKLTLSVKDGKTTTRSVLAV